MLIIVGMLVVIGSVIGGFTLSGGHVGALIHPTELLTIGGAALGALIIMCPMKVLKDLGKGIVQALMGSPYGKAAYEDLIKVMYELMQESRRNGLLALEAHIRDPHSSTIFNKYPTVGNNHHVTDFIASTLTLLVDGVVKPEELGPLMEAELKTMDEEQHAPLGVLSKTADALPGFGIVAAVLGIVITMGHIDGPVEEIGHKVGAALVGTFLGILMSYGFVAPLAVQMEFMEAAEKSYFRAIVTMLQGMADNLHPRVVTEMARRGMPTEVRPNGVELAELLREAG